MQKVRLARTAKAGNDDRGHKRPALLPLGRLKQLPRAPHPQLIGETLREVQIGDVVLVVAENACLHSAVTPLATLLLEPHNAVLQIGQVEARRRPVNYPLHVNRGVEGSRHRPALAEEARHRVLLRQRGRCLVLIIVLVRKLVVSRSLRENELAPMQREGTLLPHTLRALLAIQPVLERRRIRRVTTLEIAAPPVRLKHDQALHAEALVLVRRPRQPLTTSLLKPLRRRQLVVA